MQHGLSEQPQQSPTVDVDCSNHGESMSMVGGCCLQQVELKY
jgi:hypothetical protein